MPVRVAVSRFKAMLQMALADRSKAVITPARYTFAEDGCWFKQSSQDKIVAVWGVFRRDYFEEYEPIGDVIVAPNSIIAILSDHFVHVPTVAIEKTEDKLRIYSENARYEEPLLGTPVEELNANTKTYEDIVYPVREGFDLKALYQADISVFKKAKKSWELVKFSVKSDGIDYTVDVGAGRITHHLPSRTVLAPSREYSFALRPDMLQLLAKVSPATVYFGLVASDEEPGVVVISLKGDSYKVNYWIVPEVA